MCFFLVLGATEAFLLAVMAYDRCVSICNPLHYALRVQLAVGAWLSGIPVQIRQTCQVFSLPFCDSNQIGHFFCGLTPLVQAAWWAAVINAMCGYVVTVLFAMIPFLLILGSYVQIVSTILKLP